MNAIKSKSYNILVKTDVVYRDDTLLDQFWRFSNVIRVDLRQIESRLSQTFSDKVKIVTWKDRTHADRKAI